MMPDFYSGHSRWQFITEKNVRKITPQHMANVKILAKSESHPSVENIIIKSKKIFQQ